MSHISRSIFSHCQSDQRPALRRGLPSTTEQGEITSWDACGVGHDNVDGDAVRFAKAIDSFRFFTDEFVFSYLPREVDPLVYNMSHEDPGNVSFGEVGGLSEQIRELREVSRESSPGKKIETNLGRGITSDQSGIVSTRWDYATKRMSSLRTSRFVLERVLNDASFSV